MISVLSRPTASFGGGPALAAVIAGEVQMTVRIQPRIFNDVGMLSFVAYRPSG